MWLFTEIKNRIILHKRCKVINRMLKKLGLVYWIWMLYLCTLKFFNFKIGNRTEITFSFCFLNIDIHNTVILVWKMLEIKTKNNIGRLGLQLSNKYDVRFGMIRLDLRRRGTFYSFPRMTLAWGWIKWCKMVWNGWEQWHSLNRKNVFHLLRERISVNSRRILKK